MIDIPKKIVFANLPTKIEKLERLTEELAGPNIYIKRDDQTGFEVSGNKIRKLEYSFSEALEQNCDTLITCGGIQSNHCRAVAAIAARLGMKSVLILRGSQEDDINGNLLIDRLLGAQIYYITQKEYEENRNEIMESIKANLEKEGYKPYIIPEGASNGIGSFGYYDAMQEIIHQEKQLGINFDKIVLATGSGGTYSGLFLGSKILNYPGKICGINVAADAEFFKNRIYDIIQESLSYINIDLSYTRDEIEIIDGYVGEGYAISKQEELSFIQKFARLEGIILDPVYTGKAMYGLVEEIKKGRLFNKDSNILFVHTGGGFGLFSKKDEFNFD